MKNNFEKLLSQPLDESSDKSSRDMSKKLDKAIKAVQDVKQHAAMNKDVVNNSMKIINAASDCLNKLQQVK